MKSRRTRRGCARMTRRSCSAIARASQADTGWSPQIPLEKTVDDLLDYWRSQTVAAYGTPSAVTSVARSLDVANKRRNNGLPARMATHQLLFDLGRSPTTRDIAQAREGRRCRRAARRAVAAATPPPTRKSAASPRSIVSRACPSASGPSIRIAAARTAATTASRGSYQSHLELDADDQFASVIFVKTNFVEVLRRELDKPSWTKESDRLRHRHRPVSANRRHLQDCRAACSRRCATPRRRSASSPRGR